MKEEKMAVTKRRVRGAAPKDPKQRGEWVELRFMMRAAEHGLVVSKPWGDSARYDFVVEYRGRLRRVQVKCASWGPKEARARGGYRCHVTSRRFCWKTKSFLYRPYLKSEIEFFAIYVLPEDVWFIVPRERTQYSMLLCPRDERSKYYRYVEAWEGLKAVASAERQVSKVQVSRKTRPQPGTAPRTERNP